MGAIASQRRRLAVIDLRREGLGYGDRGLVRLSLGKTVTPLSEKLGLKSWFPLVATILRES